MNWWEEKNAVIPEMLVGRKKEMEAEVMNELMKREKRGNTWKSSRKKKKEK